MTNASAYPLLGSLLHRLQDESFDPTSLGPGRIDDLEHSATSRAYLDLGYVTPTQYRNDLLFDLTQLLRTTRRSSQGWSEHYPELRKSIFNYGLPDLNRFGFSRVDQERLADEIGAAVRTFEPRLQHAKVNVADVSVENSASVFQIAAQLRIPPRLQAISLAALLPVHNKVFCVQEQSQSQLASQVLDLDAASDEE